MKVEISMKTDPVLQTFIIESSENVQEMENSLLQLETSPDDEDTINALFRAAHTIKGSAGIVGIDNVERFTHIVENVLEQVRLGEIKVTGDLIGLLLKCCDHIGRLVDILSEGEDKAGNPDLESEGQSIMEQLTAYIVADKDDLPSAQKDTQGVAGERKEISSDNRMVETGNWHISLKFSRDVLRDGMDPLSFITYLSKLGEIAGLTTLHDAIPDAGEMDPE
ncbi:MAG TPA: chemotaxis protein CheA, partial [Nitrospirae bacterium]|nr:chemotaxis protein CheA [Nitrospirota bacterium]